jgi:hypothetical protein
MVISTVALAWAVLYVGCYSGVFAWSTIGRNIFLASSVVYRYTPAFHTPIPWAATLLLVGHPATQQEMEMYEHWRLSGEYQHFDPIRLFAAYQRSPSNHQGKHASR